MTPPPETPSSKDPLAVLDDDLGDDWESAFQAEDFMFSPEEEPSDFFLNETNAPSADDDISALFTGHDEGQEGQAAQDSSSSLTDDHGGTSTVLEFPGRLQILAASLLQLYQTRPLSQRLMIGAMPLALALIIIFSQFFQASNEQIAALDDQASSSETAPPLPPSPKEPGRIDTASQQKQNAPASSQPEPTVKPETIQHKWVLPTFIIVSGSKNKAEIIVTIDLSLTANLEKGQSLPDDKQTFVKDIIYQFYKNRPTYELKHFALSRGEMLRQLNTWLNKQWKDHPFSGITFSRYQVTRTSPPLAPKTTFM